MDGYICLNKTDIDRYNASPKRSRRMPATIATPATAGKFPGTGTVGGTAVGGAWAMTQVQWVLFVHDGFLQTPPTHTNPVRQFASIEQLLLQLTTVVGVGVLVGTTLQSSDEQFTPAAKHC